MLGHGRSASVGFFLGLSHSTAHVCVPLVVGRLQRDQAAHSHVSSRQAVEEVVEREAQMRLQAARLAKEAERRRHLEALLDQGLQVQNQILLGLQVGQHPVGKDKD